MARGFSHPNVGHEVRVEQTGCEIQLVFVCGTEPQADDLAEYLVEQLKAGALNLTLMGKPTTVVES